MASLLSVFSFVISFGLLNGAPSVDALPTNNTRPYTSVGKLNQFVSIVGRDFNIVGDRLAAMERDRDVASLDLRELKSAIKKLTQLRPGHQAECPSGWSKRFRRCFKFHKCAKLCQADDGKQQCEAEGGQLASVLSSEEQAFFIDSMNKSVGIWLGGNDRATEGTWVWADGSLIDDGYTNWERSKKNEPDGGTRNNCMVLYQSKWHDNPCTYTFPGAGYVCQTQLTHGATKAIVK